MDRSQSVQLLVRNGRVIDGTGGPDRVADVAIAGGTIVAVEPGLGERLTEIGEVIDAAGRLVTPGFIDVHTHFDGQASWDEVLDPVTGHGVTTVLMGNCGVGFAPVRPADQARLIELMEGVEDIPGSALSEGLTWGWETFPEYLDALDRRRWTVDVGTQVPHGPIRAYVLGDEPGRDADDGELAQMATLVREGIEAGGFGFTTSRTVGHRSVDGSPVPGTYAAERELETFGAAVAAAGGGVFEVAPSGLFRSDDPVTVAGEVEWMGRLAARSGLCVSFIMLQAHDQPERWRAEAATARRWRQRGGNVVPLVAARSAAVLYGWDVRHPFMSRPSYRAIADMPLGERLELLRRPTVRAAILGEADADRGPAAAAELRYLRTILPSCYVLSGRDPDYEQPVERRLGAIAEAAGTSVESVAYDAMLIDTALLRYPLYNYVSGDHSVLHEQLTDPANLVSLGDGGAHCAFICDASAPSYLLTHWVRDRRRGPRLELPDVIRRLTSQPADMYGLADRGRLAPGLRADVNVIDLDRLSLSTPYARHDLPAGGTRLVQPADGYDATIVAGQVTRRHGADTGARPGRLIRRR